jgi:OmpA-OmpF porin, OOP family
MVNYRFGLWMAATALAALTTTGCATKNWVKTQTAPIVDHTGQLEDKTAANGRAIRDTDERAQAGIKQAQSSADSATQNAQGATKAAGDAEMAANDAVHRADSLDSVVKGLDNYKPLANVTVNFGFDKSVLTKDDKDQLDSFAGQLGSAKSYILEVTGGTDSTGPAQYNYDLSQRRADAVVQYLAAKYNIPAHRFYLIGIGKDNAIADNTTAEGRKQNRRVQIQLLSNMSGTEPSAPATPPTGSGSGQ